MRLSMASSCHVEVQSWRPRNCWVIGVAMTPGLMELTRMTGPAAAVAAAAAAASADDENADRGDDGEPHSAARERVSWWTPALEAQ